MMKTIKVKETIIHGDFKTTGTSSGRLSSVNPNLMNLPTDAGAAPDNCENCKTDFKEYVTVDADRTRSRWKCRKCKHVTRTYLYDIRKMYKPHVGYKFAIADWDAMEVSLMAAVSGCPDLANLVHIRDDESRIVSHCCCLPPATGSKKTCSGCQNEAKFSPDPAGDLHTVTGAKINAITPQELFLLMHSDIESTRARGKKMRKGAKPVNFGIMYGIGSSGLATQLRDAGIPTNKAEAQGMIDAWYELFPGVKTHVDDSTRELNANKYLKNIYGRIRHVPYTDDVLSALNFLIQGAGAQIAKKVCVDAAYSFIDEPDIRLVNLIHDELVIEYKPGLEMDVAQFLFDKMNIAVPGKQTIHLTAEPEVDIASLSKSEKGKVLNLPSKE